MTELKYKYTDNGYCRVYYTWKKNIYYCAQDEGKGIIKFYRCSGGYYNEPEYTANPKEAPPLSPGNTITDVNVNNWIKNNWKLIN